LVSQADRVAASQAPNGAETTNLEAEAEFDVRWAWAEGPLEPGFTAVVRAKDEARSLPRVLPPLFRAVGRVVLIDNASTDGTPELARRVAEEAGAGERLDVFEYPFRVSRCGAEHLETPARSVHSLTYFYNWSFSHVRTAYALKWDADMVLTDSLAATLRDLAWQLEGTEALVRIPRHPLYVADERRAYLDAGLRNREPWAWPNRPGYVFGKGMEWELSPAPERARRLVLPEWGCIELKHLDTDEFANWSPVEFDASLRTRRKLRESTVFEALARGGSVPDDVVAIEAPDGRHVVDYVRETWLPEKAEEAVRG
jgi:glycosyltransferase involved in cell wall biosynthesis